MPCELAGAGSLLGYPKMIKREMNAFTNIYTLHNFREIQEISLEIHQKYRLFEIFKWFMRYGDSKNPNFDPIKDKNSVFGIDCTDVQPHSQGL